MPNKRHVFVLNKLHDKNQLFHAWNSLFYATEKEGQNRILEFEFVLNVCSTVTCGDDLNFC